ncbi:MAG: hypothetical protein HY855_26770 [Burkholderiales bacterium]|nr:hypothetical protein [Burkholderiales bacterium]
MKHFTQFIQMIRAAWDGDKHTCAEQALQLAVRLESEGDSAHARMLRFTLAALQNREQAAAPREAALEQALAPPAPRQDSSGEDNRVELTFGEWEHEAQSQH